MERHRMKGIEKRKKSQGLNQSLKRSLIESAFSALGKAYAPYSGFYVAAALLCRDGSGGGEQRKEGICSYCHRGRQRWKGRRLLRSLRDLPPGDERVLPSG